jgi:hypothetical protein
MCSIHYRGLEFSKLDGIPTEIDRYLQRKFFSFCKMPENVPLFEHMHSKL